MLQICRAEDGEIFQTNVTLWDIERTGNLELFLQEQTGVDQSAVLAYLPDGTRIRSENIQDLNGTPNNTIFVFNKVYLDHDLNDVLQELRSQPKFQPPVEDFISSTPPFRTSQISVAYLRVAHAHQEAISHVISTILHQFEALSIASRSLDLNILNIADAFDTFAVSARRELERQSFLLTSLEVDLEVVSRVRVHPEFLSLAVRRAVEAGEKARTLGDYVSNVKMRQVAEGCVKMHSDYQRRFDLIQESVNRLTEGASRVRVALSNTRLIESAEVCKRRAADLVERTTDTAAALESPASAAENLMQELRSYDARLRDEVEAVSQYKNSSTELCINTLRRISVLNVDLVQLPKAISTLQADLRLKTNFGHIQRLHNMLYAYGATLVEIVRRKEFARFFYQRAQTILEAMAKLTASERKRRQIYRGEVHGQLPFDTRGMDRQVPMIDFSPSGEVDSDYSLERADVDDFLNALDEIEKVIEPSLASEIPNVINETRNAVEKLLGRIDSLESSFDRIVERSVLSSSRMSQSRRRIADAEDAAVQELSEQLIALKQARNEQEASAARQKREYEDEIAMLKAQLEESREAAESGRSRASAFERDMRSAKSQHHCESTARQAIETRHTELLSEVERLREDQVRALNNATEQAKAAEFLREELSQVRAEFEDLRKLEAKKSEKIAQLLGDQAATLRNLQEARARGEDLESRIHAAQTDNSQFHLALKEANEEKERLLKMQAMEHDRVIRDHIAEADGDRAVLEHQFSQIKGDLDESERRLKEAKAEVEVLNADTSGLREELQRAEHELRESRHIEHVLRDDLSSLRSSYVISERNLENRNKILAQALELAIAFRDSQQRATTAVQSLIIHPNNTNVKANGTTTDSLLLSGVRPTVRDDPQDLAIVDISDPVAALQILKSFNSNQLADSINKAGSMTRKLYKQCKEYRERSKGKITFRDFAKGDLALFLPTKNSMSRPWAAFNISFPHYFLQAAGRLAEQLKTREWIVARITSITERVADENIPESNPYGLGNGVKYYMLEVEDWTQPGSAVKKRNASGKKGGGEKPPDPPQHERSISPPPAEPPQASVSPIESVGATRSPTSHLFPVRTRAEPHVGPSSLSKLFAQEEPSDNILDTTPFPNHPPSPTTRHVLYGPSPVISSPLRPGSRASSSSRFSVTGGRFPPFSGSTTSGSPGTSKAAATIALSSDLLVPSPPSAVPGFTPDRTSSPSPSTIDSVAEQRRRRTTSEHVTLGRSSSLSVRPATPSATTALASFAANWGMGLGRKRRDSEVPSISENPSDPVPQGRPRGPATDLLRRF